MAPWKCAQRTFLPIQEVSRHQTLTESLRFILGISFNLLALKSFIFLLMSQCLCASWAWGPPPNELFLSLRVFCWVEWHVSMHLSDVFTCGLHRKKFSCGEESVPLDAAFIYGDLPLEIHGFFWYSHMCRKTELGLHSLRAWDSLLKNKRGRVEIRYSSHCVPSPWLCKEEGRDSVLFAVLHWSLRRGKGGGREDVQIMQCYVHSDNKNPLPCKGSSLRLPDPASGGTPRTPPTPWGAPHRPRTLRDLPPGVTGEMPPAAPAAPGSPRSQHRGRRRPSPLGAPG